MINEEDFFSVYEQLQLGISNKKNESVLINVSVSEDDDSKRRVVLYHKIGYVKKSIADVEFVNVPYLYYTLLPSIMEVIVKNSSDIKEEDYFSSIMINDEETTTRIFSGEKVMLELIGLETDIVTMLAEKKNEFIDANEYGELSSYDSALNLINEGRDIFQQLGELFPENEMVSILQNEFSSLEKSIINGNNRESKKLTKIDKGIDPNSFIQSDFLQEQILVEMKKSIETLPIETPVKKFEYDIDPSTLIPLDVMSEQLESILVEERESEGDSKGIDPNSFIQSNILQEQILTEMKKSIMTLPIETLNEDSLKGIDPSSRISVDFLHEQLASAMSDTDKAKEVAEEVKTDVNPNDNISLDILKEQLASGMIDDKEVKEQATGTVSSVDPNSSISLDILNEQLAGAISNTEEVSETVAESLTNIDPNGSISIDILNEQLAGVMSDIENTVDMPIEDVLEQSSFEESTENKGVSIDIPSDPVPEPKVIFDSTDSNSKTLFEQIIDATKGLREQLGDLFAKGFCINKLQEKRIYDLSELVQKMEAEYKKVITAGLESVIDSILVSGEAADVNIRVRSFEMPDMVLLMLENLSKTETLLRSSIIDQLKDAQMSLEICNVLRDKLNDSYQLEDIARITNENIAKRANILTTINTMNEKFISENIG